MQAWTDGGKKKLVIKEQCKHVVPYVELIILRLIVGAPVCAITIGMIPSAILISILGYRRFQGRCV